MTRWVAFQVLYGVALGLALGAHLLGEGSGIPCLIILSLLQLYPFFCGLFARSFDFMAFMLLGSFGAYALYRYGEWWMGPRPFQFSPDAVLEMHVLALCMLAMLAGFYACRSLFMQHLEYQYVQRAKFIQTFVISTWQAVSLFALVIGISLLTRDAGSIRQPLLASSGVALTLLLTSRIEGARWKSYFLWSFLILHSAYLFLWTGTLQFGVSVTLIWIVQLLLFRSPRFAVALFAMGVLLVSLQMIKADFRGLIKRQAVQGTTERARAVASTLADKITTTKRSRNSLLPSVVVAISRVGDNSMQKVLQQTPDPIPYWGGRSYVPLLYAFIPRLLWPERPSRDIWHQFGKIYGYLEPYDHNTSVTLNYLSEAFMNFGMAWLFSVAFFVGVLAALAEYVALFALGGSFAFTHTLLVLKLLLPNDTVSIVTDLTATFIFLWVLDWWVKKNAAAPAPLTDAATR